MFCLFVSHEISVGVRASLELESYIQERFDKVPECTVCHAIALSGPECPRRNCSVRLHARCARQWFVSKDSSLVRQLLQNCF